MALKMASAKQVEANRANASRSCGPRSLEGKDRASRNAVRHGLTMRRSSASHLAALDQLARQFAGACANPMVRELARIAAEAELELGRVRAIKVALIERSSVLGGLKPPKHFRGKMEEVRYCQKYYLWLRGLEPIRPPMPIPIETITPLSSGGLDEAVGPVLAELSRLIRYHDRAAARRDAAICEMLKAKAECTCQLGQCIFVQNEPNFV